MNKFKLHGLAKIMIPLLLVFIFNQCMHDEYDFSKLDNDFEINAGILSPVAYGSLDFSDIISEFDSTSDVSSFSDGLLYLAFQDSLFSLIGNELLQLGNQDFLEFFVEADFPFFPGWSTVAIDRTDKFPFIYNNGEKLDSIELNQGNMVFNITSDFHNTGLIQMVFPNIQLDGVPLVYTINITDPSGTFSSENTIPIDGYTIILEDSTTNDTTYLPVNFHIELYDEGVPISGTERIDIIANFTDLDFNAVFGYVGDYDLVSQAGELDLSFFEKGLEGYIKFEDPQINFNIHNSYGVPAEVDIFRFTGFDANGDSTLLDIYPSANPFRYAFPTLTDYFNSDLYKDTVMSINRSNSTLPDFLSNLPSRIEYNMIAKSNPDGESGPYNFLTKDSKIDVDFEFLLPFWFKADSFALKDTIDLDLLNIDDDASFIEKITIMLEVTNGLPLDIDFQMYFLDSLYNTVDTLFSENDRPIIASGILGADDTVVAPGTKTSIIEYTKSDITKLNTVKYAAIRAGLKTPTVEGVLAAAKIFTDYKVSFNMSVGVDVKANSNDF